MCRAWADADGLRARFLNLKDSAMSCPSCTSSRLTAIQIRLAPDEDHTLRLLPGVRVEGLVQGRRRRPPGPVLSLASERRF